MCVNVPKLVSILSSLLYLHEQKRNKKNGLIEVLKSIELRDLDIEYIKSAIIVLLTTYVLFKYILQIDVLFYVLFISSSNLYIATLVALEVSIMLLILYRGLYFFITTVMRIVTNLCLIKYKSYRYLIGFI